MLDNPVYFQKRSGDCGDYAYLSALRNLGVDVSEEYMVAMEGMSLMNVARRLIRDKKITGIATIDTLSGTEFWLKKGHYIVAGTGKMSFNSVRKPPHIQAFDGNVAHNFCIVPYDHPTLFKIKDSQGNKFADKGYWYVEKSDFRKLKKFRVYL